MPSLPPLTALRAFEAAARHSSFTKAADELCVTQSAVSRHIRYLEERLSKTLFVRTHRVLVLTPDGQRYFDDLSGLFRQIEWATARLVDNSGREQLHLHSHTTFAQRWLITRLVAFNAQNPGIDIRISASTAAFEPDDTHHVHAVIHAANDPLDSADRLFPVTYVPVCTPEYRDAEVPNGAADELDSALMIHALGAPHAWPAWFGTCLSRSSRNAREVRVETTSMAISAALTGLGVAIASWPFVRDAVERGQLVVPVPSGVVLRRSFYFLPVGQSKQTSAVERFRSWLLGEVQHELPYPDGLQVLPQRTF